MESGLTYHMTSDGLFDILRCVNAPSLIVMSKQKSDDNHAEGNWMYKLTKFRAYTELKRTSYTVRPYFNIIYERALRFVFTTWNIWANKILKWREEEEKKTASTTTTKRERPRNSIYVYGARTFTPPRISSIWTYLMWTRSKTASKTFIKTSKQFTHVYLTTHNI